MHARVKQHLDQDCLGMKMLLFSKLQVTLRAVHVVYLLHVAFSVKFNKSLPIQSWSQSRVAICSEVIADICISYLLTYEIPSRRQNVMFETFFISSFITHVKVTLHRN